MSEPIAEVGKLAGLCGWVSGAWEKIVINASHRLEVAIAEAVAQECQLYGWDGDSWEKLQVDPSKYLEVTLPRIENIAAQTRHFDGSDWRNSNMLFGYNAIWDEDLGGSAGATVYEANTSTIPAGELWILQAVSAVNFSEASNNVLISITRASGATVYIAGIAPLAQYIPLLVTGTFVLQAGDVVQLYMDGVTATNTIKAGVIGYKMDLEM